ncbi:MAG: GNAT family N-acetyltransferase [Planctomycetota bacterium]|nr:GNAT family N-acetyltransferase [Planctomycetota bacterium]
MPHDITEMTMADYDAVFAFWRQQEGIGLNDADGREHIAAFLRRNPGMSFIARERGRIIAAVLCGHDGRRGTLHHLAVAPSHRNRGLGRTIVQRCLDRLRDEGILKCGIFVFSNNKEGERFWLTTGWFERSDLKLLQQEIDPRP